jgi:hypothetical protein
MKLRHRIEYNGALRKVLKVQAVAVDVHRKRYTRTFNEVIED